MGSQRPAKWEEAKAYVRENEQELRSKYGDNYVAVTPIGVIDYDESETELAKRVLGRSHMNVSPLITRVDEVFNPMTCHIHTPFIE